MAPILPLPALADRADLGRQYDLLVRLQGLLNDDRDCLGAAVGGSIASGAADEMSDVDLVVYCRPGAARRILQSLSAEAADSEVVHRLQGEHDTCSVYEKVILADWRSYEIHVIEPSTRMRLRPPYVEIVDNEGYLAGRVAWDKPIGRDAARPFVHGEAGLIWELFNCIKWLRRGQTAFTLQYLRALGARLGAPSSDGDA